MTRHSVWRRPASSSGAQGHEAVPERLGAPKGLAGRGHQGRPVPPSRRRPRSSGRSTSRAGRRHRRRGAPEPAAADDAVVLAGPSGRAALPALLISGHRVRRIDLRRANARGEETPAHRPRSELIGLGAANLGAPSPGGYPVTGGLRAVGRQFRRRRRDTGGGRLHRGGPRPRGRGADAAVYSCRTRRWRDDQIRRGPGLGDFSILKRTWAYAKATSPRSRDDPLTLGSGCEAGVAAGVILSLLLHGYKTSRPHVAEVGLVPGTQHFRNIRRHTVETRRAS